MLESCGAGETRPRLMTAEDGPSPSPQHRSGYDRDCPSGEATRERSIKANRAFCEFLGEGAIGCRQPSSQRDGEKFKDTLKDTLVVYPCPVFRYLLTMRIRSRRGKPMERVWL
jgi:hypothetical protein